MNHFIGSKYDANLSIVDICKKIRTQLKDEIKKNTLFEEAKFSVRKRDYNAISIVVLEMGFNPQNPLRIQEYIKNPHSAGTGIPLYSPKGLEFLNRIKEIANAYNYDKSDTQIDYFSVNFYLDLGLHYNLEEKQREEVAANIDQFLQEMNDSLPLCPECGKKVLDSWDFEDKKGLCWDCVSPLIKARDDNEKEKYKRQIEETEQILQKLVNVFEIPGGGIIDRICFPKLNKRNTLKGYFEQLHPGQYHVQSRVMIKKVIVLTAEQYEIFSNHLLHRFEWLEECGGSDSTAEGLSSDDYYKLSPEEQKTWEDHSYLEVVKIVCDGKPAFFVNPEGYGYARYVGFSEDYLEK